MGLSLTRNFVELHHGRIEVQSVFGEGSCFSLYLPVDFDAAAATLPIAIGGGVGRASGAAVATPARSLHQL